MSEKKSRKQKRAENNKLLVISIILIFLTIPFMVYTANVYMQRSELQAKRDLLIEQIEAARLQQELYEDEISKIGSPKHYEYLARKLLGYIYEGETVMVITDKNGGNK
ncbi:MAG: septum formation initiator family protein [Eubacteriaceae bacterium]|nr:septum formation initiator family protein [Eubacteriaceae bacterium]